VQDKKPCRYYQSMQSPDIPWARSTDARIRKRIEAPPSPAVPFFIRFLGSKGIRDGRLIDLGCGNGRNAVFFAKKGFEVHAVDKSDEILADLDLHGVMPHCHSVTDSWLFEDAFFDLAIDIFCYSSQEENQKKIYRSELARVLKSGGYFLLSVPSGYKQKQLALEFPGFSIVASQESADIIDGKKEKTLDLILRKA